MTPAPGTLAEPETQALPRSPDRASANPAAAGVPHVHAHLAGIPAPANGLHLLGEVAGSGHKTPPSLVRRADGQTLQLTPLLYAVLAAIDGHRSIDEIGAVVAERTGKLVNPDDLRYVIDHKLCPLGVLRQVDGTDPPTKPCNPLLALRWRVVVSNPRVTRRITSPFAWLFKPVVAVPVTIAFAVASAWLLFDKGLASATHQALYEPGLLLLVVALAMLSAGFHEFGHAAACRYGGATPGAMGMGLYLIWPAFYTEVSDSYRLDRRGRLRVDVGGLYFNAIFALSMLGVWAVTRSDALLLLVPAQLLQMARQLLPFVRFDGYHILADMTGVPDLFWHIKPTLLGLLPRRWRRPQPQHLKPWARRVVTLWVVLVVPILGLSLFLMIKVLPRIVATAWDSLGQQAGGLVHNYHSGDEVRVAIGMLAILALSIPLLSMVYLLARLTWRASRRIWRATAGRPKSRGAAVVLAAGLVAMVGWLWWPQGQYQPITHDERGRVQDTLGVDTAPVVTQSVMTAAQMDPPQPVPAAAESVFTPTAPTFAEVADPQQIEAAEPRLGVVFTPTDDDPDASEQVVVLPPPSAVDPPSDETGLDRGEWPFPFNQPRTPRAADNQALAVNTVDGASVYDVTLAWVWVSDGETVDHHNDAYAFASCRDCTTVAVAFQTIFVLGQSDVIIPQNVAVAVNYECMRCETWAIAVQLIVSLTDTPSDVAMEELNALWSELEAIDADAEELSPSQVHQELVAMEDRILQVLAADEGASATSTEAVTEASTSEPAETSTVEPTETATITGTEPTASAEPSETSGGSAEEEPTTTEASEEPTADPAPTTDPEPTEPAGTTSSSESADDSQTEAESGASEPTP